MAPQSGFPVDTARTAIAIAYRNSKLIADLVLPRAGVNLQQFEFYQYGAAERFTVPDTKVGRKSEPNVVNFSATKTTASTEDYALDDIIPQKDIDNAPAGVDPLNASTEGTTDLILLDREVRAANLVFGASNYPTGYKVTLAGNDQWNSGDTASDPIPDIQTALDTPLVRPNTLVFGQAVWTTFRSHPSIVASINRNDGDKGIASRAEVAALFEVDQVLVGEGRLNTAKPGQTASVSRVWGKFCAALYVDPQFNFQAQNRITWGATAQFGTRFSGSMSEPKLGLYGSTRNRVGESVLETVIASQAGYLISGAIS